jgi:hypothetical protein
MCLSLPSSHHPTNEFNALNKSNALNSHIVLQFPIFVFNPWEQVDFWCKGDQQMEAILKTFLSKDFSLIIKIGKIQTQGNELGIYFV